MKALKIILVVVAVLVICVVLLGLYGQLEDRRRDTAWVQKENAEKSEEQKFLPTIELFDLGLGDANSTGEDQFWFREVHGRVRNKSPKSLYRLAIKISILDSSGAL